MYLVYFSMSVNAYKIEGNKVLLHYYPKCNCFELLMRKLVLLFDSRSPLLCYLDILFFFTVNESCVKKSEKMCA